MHVDNMVGRGGYEEVYNGMLSDCQYSVFLGEHMQIYFDVGFFCVVLMGLDYPCMLSCIHEPGSSGNGCEMTN